MKSAAADAWLALTDALGYAGRTPCADRLEWISESAEDRTAAAAECRDCPVINACHTYADAAKEKAGVWGGRDRTVKQGRPATTKEPTE